MHFNPPPGLGVTVDILHIWKLRLRELCKFPRVPHLGLGRPGLWAPVCLTLKPHLDQDSVSPADGSCTEPANLGKVQLCLAVDQASCPLPRPCPEMGPVQVASRQPLLPSHCPLFLFVALIPF